MDPHLPNQAALDRVVVVLVATRNSLNIGAAARAMSNFGFPHLRLVRPWDPSFQEAKDAERSAVGAGDLLARAVVFPSVAEAVADCTLVLGTTAVTAGGRRDLLHPLDGLEASAELVQAHLQNGESRVAILFGSEKTGLSNDDLSHCHRLLRIPTREEHISMNLGQAVAICLYELGAARTLRLRSGQAPNRAARGPADITAVDAASHPVPASADEPALALSAEIERLTVMILEALQASGYIAPGAEKATEEKLRRLFRRFALTRQDAQLALGMARQVLWKLRPPLSR
jgi:TrmH family RNA methyltransferase